MEARFGSDCIVVELATALCEGEIEIGEGFEVAVDEGLIEQRPEALGGLELGAVGRQVDELDAVGDGQANQAVPAGIVEHEDDGALAARTGGSGEGGEQGLEEGFGDAVGEIPDDLARAGSDEGGHIKPFVAMVAEGDGALTDRRPDPPADRLQPEPVLVGCSDLDRPLGVFRRGVSDRVVEFF